MKNQHEQQVIGIPVTSASYSIEKTPRRYSSRDTSDATSRLVSMLKRMNVLGKKADNFAHRIREHVRLGPKITETVKGKLTLGARILQVGGVEKIFKQYFSVRQGEKLLKACQCYLSTTSGPIAGLLFISTEKVAFYSDRTIKIEAPNGQLVRAHYKVVIPLGKIKSASQSVNVNKKSQKYIDIDTVDDFDFWFMGFLNHQKAFKCLQMALSQSFVDHVQVTF